ncbi:BatD family protein [Flavobacteriaceae bacterium F89]|uniref:BatD family protein n=1 Tax=Cerina litoralis TaxID=2874477 RepID=A0AAE3EV90_9FLAO|nr:BatD family protein [Cerina litoralis]MCG2461705.1 BatD family protein [Cerina litoralis]
MVRKLTYMLFFLLSVAEGYGQQLISYVTVSHTDPYVGQPVQMTVSVYTETWFTQGVDVGNIQVEGALTVYFRSLPNQRTFNGKRFTGVDFIYNLFPTQPGPLRITPLHIDVVSPRPGDSKGIKHTLATKAKKLTVKDIPLGINPNEWLVSSSLDVSQRWNASLITVKVGDVLQRTITRSAGGTLSEFIPAAVWDSVAGVGIYPKRPITRTEKTKTYVSGFRSETVNYLFEKEGTVILPKQEFLHWNVRYNKYYKRIIDSITINVAPNPNLGILTGIKKQLESETKAEQEPEQKAKLIFGMTWKEFLKLIATVLALSVIAFYSLKWALLNVRERYRTYKESEQNAFRRVRWSLRYKKKSKFFDFAKRWLLKLELKERSLDFFIQQYGTENLRQNYIILKTNVFDNNTSINPNYSVLNKELALARKQFLKKRMSVQKHEVQQQEKDWLNPIGIGE